MIPYTYFERELIPDDALQQLDSTGLIAAFNSSERVRRLWETFSPSIPRVWAVHHEYKFSDDELPQGAAVRSEGLNEADFADELIKRIVNESGTELCRHRLAVDITGFMRPELICLVQQLRFRGAGVVHFLYSEPTRYTHKGWTQFSKGNVVEVRQVLGCEGTHELETDRDLLIIGTGYDDMLMSAVAEHKAHAAKRLIFGFPSLAPDMYQENVWRVNRAAESIGAGAVESRAEHIFAPANDPFETADAVSAATYSALSGGARNVYLAPLGTKVQALGFGLFYAFECQDRPMPVSVILPFTEGYEKRTSAGHTRTWRFTVDFRLGATA